MRKLSPGTNVRIEYNAHFVGLADKENPYWYEVEYPVGHRDTVLLARINRVVDRCRTVIDTDASIQLFSPRLSAEGALDLLLWLETHCHEFEAVTQEQESEQMTQGIGYAPNGSNYHDHLCRCPGCNPQPPDEA